MTARGIEYDLPKSPYTYEKEIQGNEVKLYFSSAFYCNKFKEIMNDGDDIVSTTLRMKYNVIIDTELCYTLAMYKRIEKRGFFVQIKPVEADYVFEYRSIENILMKAVIA